MAINFSLNGPSFKLTPQDMGTTDIGAALRSGLQTAADIYKPKTAAEQLLGMKLQNKINDAKAQYAMQNEAANLAHTQAGTSHLNADTGLTSFRRKLLEAQAAQASAKSDELTRKQRMIEQLFGGGAMGGGASNAQEVQPGQPGQEGGGAYQPGSSMPPYADQLKQSNQVSYPQAAFMQHELGLGQPKIIDVDGKKMAVTPFGNIPIAQGQTPLQKELNKVDAKQLGELEKTAIGGLTTQTTLDSLGEVVKSDVFNQMRQNPIAGSLELKAYAKYGTPEQQAMSNRYMTETGQIIKDAARDFHGQFRVGEQALLNTMKPSLSDTGEGARSKVEALSYMNKMLTKRAQIAANLIRNNGYSPLQAYEVADHQVNGKQVRELIKQSLKPNEHKIVNGVKYIKENGKWYQQ